MKNLAIILTSLIPFLFSFTTSEINQLNHCEAPANIHVDAQNNTSVTFDWDDCNCFNTGYHVYYVKDGVSSQEWVTGNSTFTFSNLSGGAYKFYFYTVCTSEHESFIVEELLDI